MGIAKVIGLAGWAELEGSGGMPIDSIQGVSQQSVDLLYDT